MRQLLEAVRSKYPSDPFFDGFADSCRQSRGKAQAYRTYEDALHRLDPHSWEVLKAKATAHFRDHRQGQLKQGFFNQLNDAFAYRHLVQRGCQRVQILEEAGAPVPDLEYFEAGKRASCEVKTLGISDEEVVRRGSGRAFANVYLELAPGVFSKMRRAIAAARSQIAAHGPDGLVYLVVVPDDFALDNYKAHRRSIASFARADRVTNVHIKFGVRFGRRMQL